MVNSGSDSPAFPCNDLFDTGPAGIHRAVIGGLTADAMLRIAGKQIATSALRPPRNDTVWAGTAPIYTLKL